MIILQHINIINIYPNPSHSILNVHSIATIASISIINYVGQVVYFSDNIGDNYIMLNTNSYPQGVYLIQIETDLGIATKRAIIN